MSEYRRGPTVSGSMRAAPEGKYLEHWERAKAEVEEELAMTEGDQELKQAQ